MIAIEGRLKRSLGITRAELKQAAEFFAEKSGKRVGEKFREVTVILQNDEESAEVHEGIMQTEGPTDVITQRYDPMPGEEQGVYGEIYVNADRALELGGRKELLLYVAHGMDHLSGADDHGEKNYRTMRRRELRWLSAIR